MAFLLVLSPVREGGGAPRERGHPNIRKARDAMKIIKGLCGVIDTINDVLGRAFAFLIFAVMGIIMCEVILRRLFDKPQIWTSDLITMLFGAYIILTLAFGLLHKSYVGVDLMVERLPAVKRHWLHLITGIAFQIPYVTFLIPRSSAFFLKSLNAMERGYSVWSPVMWPVKFSLFLGLLLLGLQIASELLKEAVWLITFYQDGRKEPAPVRSMSLLCKKNSLAEKAGEEE